MNRLGRDLTLAPNIRPESPCRDFSTGDVMKRNRKGRPADMNTSRGVEVIQCPVDAGRVDTAQFSQGFSGVGFGNLDPHETNVHTFCEISKGKTHKSGDIAESATLAHTSGMAAPKKPREGDPWKQRARFVELLDSKIGEGATLEEIASALLLKTTRSLEFSYRFDRSRIPKRNTMEAAAKYFGVPLSEIYSDDEFIPSNESSEKAKVLASAMYQDLKELPEDQQEILYQLWKQAQAIGKARIAAERQDPK